MTRRLITIAHSYCVALNRRLAHEMARAGVGRWEVTAIGPAFFHGDLRPIVFESFSGEACNSVPVAVHASKLIHVMCYGRRLRDLLKEPCDLVHCWEEPFIVAGGQVAWWTPDAVPIVYASFQNIRKSYPIPFRWIERNAIARSAGWIAFGKTVEENLAPQPMYAARPHRVIALGVDMDVFQPSVQSRQSVREHCGWTDAGPPVVGFLGRFTPEKGIDLLMRTLDRTESPWRALFVGSGQMETEIRGWAARHGERVRIQTGVRHDEVPAYLNAMDVLCAPSQTTARWREQLGRMLIEAFACGVPVIGSDSGEIPFVVSDAGLVVAEADENAWVSALSALLESPDRRADLSRHGLRRAKEVYSWPIIARQHLDFFEEIVESRNR